MKKIIFEDVLQKGKEANLNSFEQVNSNPRSPTVCYLPLNILDFLVSLRKFFKKARSFLEAIYLLSSSASV